MAKGKKPNPFAKMMDAKEDKKKGVKEGSKKDKGIDKKKGFKD